MSSQRTAVGQVALIGVGLIGGSIGLAVRERLPGAQVTGFDNDADVLARARELGAIDTIAASLEAAVSGADIVVVAVPVGVLPEVAKAALQFAGPDAVVTDVGSTKRQIVAAIDDPRFIGGHPIAGAETAGVDHARADLFDGATWFLTPTETTTGTGLEKLMRMVGGLGAKAQALDAATHDRLLAEVSHLPHVLANALVSQAADSHSAPDGGVTVIGPSFRDVTRVAGANTSIWKDIYLTNRDALAPAIDDMIARLAEFRDALNASDGDAIARLNDRARSDRHALLEQDLVGGDVCELRVSVPNEPGVLAQITLVLGRAGVNIVDMALYPAPDARSGAVSLWVAGDEMATRTEELIAQLGFPVARA